MQIKNEIVTIDNQKWHVVEAESMAEAENAIAMARVTGSEGSNHFEERDGTKKVLAIVKRYPEWLDVRNKALITLAGVWLGRCRGMEYKRGTMKERRACLEFFIGATSATLIMNADVGKAMNNFIMFTALTGIDIIGEIENLPTAKAPEVAEKESVSS